jgi:hypothetical protein
MKMQPFSIPAEINKRRVENPSMEYVAHIAYNRFVRRTIARTF